jgi:hypothetical protein
MTDLSFICSSESDLEQVSVHQECSKKLRERRMAELSLGWFGRGIHLVVKVSNHPTNKGVKRDLMRKGGRIFNNRRRVGKEGDEGGGGALASTVNRSKLRTLHKRWVETIQRR